MPEIDKPRIDVKIVTQSECLPSLITALVNTDRMASSGKYRFLAGDIIYLNKIDPRGIQLSRFYLAIAHSGDIYFARVMAIDKNECLILSYSNGLYPDQALPAVAIKALYVVFKVVRKQTVARL